MSNFPSACFSHPLTHMDAHTYTHSLTLSLTHSALPSTCSLLPLSSHVSPPFQPEASSLHSLLVVVVLSSFPSSLPLSISSPPPDTQSSHKSDQSEASGWVINSRHSVISDWLSKSHSLREASIHNKHRQPGQGRPSKPLPRKTGGKYTLNFLKVKLLTTLETHLTHIYF